ncbi:type II toxin-antitoxin system Phd/YefM family antitoxin [Myroides profundi]|uniref:Antitoxin n=1 Tax=Myroides profundi TaxID=480520 RepID=A0AAJ4W4W1_MYRPR|nr:type II toxin-antitoxin system Phd/YefM family antitoxin [Myroides profundi]AJH15548.1 hypothetical protein MPR_2377 [Myroides profundi]SER06929.1 Antitoxin Phd_YefM, type II toxin-antitoxin system [Myroides profundi]
MKTISVSEFRKNIKKYIELASNEKIVVNRGEGKAFLIIPIDQTEDEEYDVDFVQKVLRAEKDILEGDFLEIKDVKNLWADIS